MRAIGLDIGTTTLSAIVLDTEAGVLTSRTSPNAATIPGTNPWERTQDPEIIGQAAESMLSQLQKDHGPVHAIGLTGQMHGMLYLDARGQARSPLYTWQDARGNQPMTGERSYAQVLTDRTGCEVATGFGTVTHFVQQQRGAVPEDAVTFTTIGGYLGMRLTGRRQPLLHASETASFGLYGVAQGCFEEEAIRRAGMDPAFFPSDTQALALLGATRRELLGAEIPVCLSIGDNQASFAGAVRDTADSILINVGTGGQLSRAITEYSKTAHCETRPYLEGSFLLCGCPLCAGSAYALLEGFFRQVAVAAGMPEDRRMYDLMAAWAEAGMEAEDPLQVITLFDGTRQQPELRGDITNIGLQNFTPAHLTAGFLTGMAAEFKSLYDEMQQVGSRRQGTMVLSGNGVRLNPSLRGALTRAFAMSPVLPTHLEEAAYGAALCALRAVGAFDSLPAAQRLIRYEGEAATP